MANCNIKASDMSDDWPLFTSQFMCLVFFLSERTLLQKVLCRNYIFPLMWSYCNFIYNFYSIFSKYLFINYVDDNGKKVKTMEYIASHKSSFKWSVKDDILHYDTPQILALIQQPASISNCFLGVKKHKLEELSIQVSTWK